MVFLSLIIERFVHSKTFVWSFQPENQKYKIFKKEIFVGFKKRLKQLENVIVFKTLLLKNLFEEKIYFNKSVMLLIWKVFKQHFILIRGKATDLEKIERISQSHRQIHTIVKVTEQNFKIEIHTHFPVTTFKKKEINEFSIAWLCNID